MSDVGRWLRKNEINHTLTDYEKGTATVFEKKRILGRMEYTQRTQAMLPGTWPMLEPEQENKRSER